MEYFDELTKLFEGEYAYLFEPKQKKQVVTADDRLISSFKEITLFVRSFEREPDPDAEDMIEAILGTSLNSIRTNKDQATKLKEYDELKLLELDEAPESLDELFSNDKNGIFKSDLFDLSTLPKLKKQIHNSSEPAQREKIDNFTEEFQQLFVEQQTLLESGQRKLTHFNTVDQLLPNNFYVYDGMMCYVSKFLEKERKAGGYTQQRILVIFENGTKSNMYRRSLAQRLYEDGGYAVVDKEDHTSLVEKNKDIIGFIYILQSLSNDPKITTIANLYKIGVTTDTVENRIRNAQSDPTYLMAPVKIIDTYSLTGEYNPSKVESLIHRIFAGGKIDLQITDKFKKNYSPQEWYSVPIETIREAIDLINNGEIIHYHYDKKSQTLVLNK